MNFSNVTNTVHKSIYFISNCVKGNNFYKWHGHKINVESLAKGLQETGSDCCNIFLSQARVLALHSPVNLSPQPC